MKTGSRWWRKLQLGVSAASRNLGANRWKPEVARALLRAGCRVATVSARARDGPFGNVSGATNLGFVLPFVSNDLCRGLWKVSARDAGLFPCPQADQTLR